MLLLFVHVWVHENIANYYCTQKKHIPQYLYQLQNLVEMQLESTRIKARKEDIVRRLLELKDREERLHYFDEHDKITVGMGRAPRFKSLEEAEKEEQFVQAPGERTKKKGT